MADKKTSQEASGQPIQGADEWRIARSGSNYKLTSLEIFNETITNSAFLVKAASGGLIPGRTYKVTGCGSGGGKTFLVQALETDRFSNLVFWYQNTQDLTGTFVMTDSFLTSTHGYLDVTGSIWLQPEISASIIGYNNTLQNVQALGGAFFNVSNTNLHDVNMVTLGGMVNITSSDLHNVNIIAEDGTDITIVNCHLSNCTLRFEQNVTLYYVNIEGFEPNVTDLKFDVSPTTGTLVAGEFNSLQYPLNLASGVVYNAGTEELTLPTNNAWVGVYLLQNLPSANNSIAKIYNCGNIYTPIKFQHDGTNGDEIKWTHQTSIAGTGPDEICLASHHGSNDHLDSAGSWTLMKYDGTIWRGIETNNWNA